MKKILVLYSIITSCAVTPHLEQLKQGISGKVYAKHGNQMPSPGRKPDEGKPVKCTIFVYELTKRNQATDNGVHFANIQTKLIARGQSNDEGYYAIALPQGRYSVFVDDGNQLYANIFDGQGNISPVEVKKDSLSNKNITINSKAFY